MDFIYHDNKVLWLSFTYTKKFHLKFKIIVTGWFSMHLVLYIYCHASFPPLLKSLYALLCVKQDTVLLSSHQKTLYKACVPFDPFTVKNTK